MLAKVSVIRSPNARRLFLGSVVVSWVVYLLATDIRSISASNGLTPIFLRLFEVGDRQGALAAILVLVASASVSGWCSVRPFLRWVGCNTAAIAIGAFIVLSAGSCFVYQNSRLSMDEYAPFFQSQIFAAGHLSGQFPVQLMDWLIPREFQNYFFNLSSRSGEVASAYWPSFALILTPFSFLGIPWACNPAISALTLWSMHRLALRIFKTTEAAGMAVLLTAASPVFFADGISYYSMSAHLLANTIFVLLLMEPTPQRAFVAGIVGSVALTLHNPVPHMVFAVPWIISILRRPNMLATFGSLLAGYLPLVILFGFGWFFYSSHLTHDGAGFSPSDSSFAQIFAQLMAVPFLPSVTLLLARVIGLAKIWTWSVPGMMLLAGWGFWRWRDNQVCVLLTASAIVTFAMYVLIPFDQGHGWGFRYFHAAWMALPILGAAAFAPLPTVHADEGGTAMDGGLNYVVICALLSLIVCTGLRAFQMHEFISRQESQVPQYAGTERRVVIVDVSYSFYGYDRVQNDPWLRGKTIRMITRGATADAQMMRERFPDMHFVYKDRFGSVWSTK